MHKVADRHEDLHGRRFAETQAATVEADQLRDAILRALDELGLSCDTGKVVITVDWPHDA